MSFTNGLFFQAKQNGYRTLLVATYIPFPQMLGSLLDASHVQPLNRYLDSRTFTHRMLNHAASIMIFAKGPFQGGWYSRIPRIRWMPNQLGDSFFLQTVRNSIEVTKCQLAVSFGPQDFLMAHVTLPHEPLIFLENGTRDAVRATYDSQLRYTDSVFGDLMRLMLEANIYGPSWVILTSDHGYKPSTFNRPNWRRHVPLLIKPPDGTFLPRRIQDPIHMWEMGPFFKAVFQGRATDECLALLAPADHATSIFHGSGDAMQ